MASGHSGPVLSEFCVRTSTRDNLRADGSSDKCRHSCNLFTIARGFL